MTEKLCLGHSQAIIASKNNIHKVKEPVLVQKSGFRTEKKTTKKYYICNNYGVFTSTCRNRTIYGQRKIDNNSRSNSQYRRDLDITKAQSKRLPDHDKSADEQLTGINYSDL